MNDIFINPRNRARGLTIERANPAAMRQNMEARGFTPRALAVKMGIPENTVLSYLSGRRKMIPSKHIDKMASIFKCDELDLVLTEMNEEPAFKPRPVIVLDDVAKRPLPQYLSGERYHIRTKKAQAGIDGVFKFVGTAPGSGGRTHFMFQHTVGKYPITFTDIDINSGAVRIESCAKAQTRAA